MRVSLRRNLPGLFEGEEFNYNSYYSPPILENPENSLAKESPQEYIEALREKIRLEHIQQMESIQTRHKETMRSLGASVTNNYLNGLSSQHKSEINEIEIKPYVWENNLFGLKNKSEGITIKFKR
jgi:hypothetical protein